MVFARSDVPFNFQHFCGVVIRFLIYVHSETHVIDTKFTFYLFGLVSNIDFEIMALSHV